MKKVVTFALFFSGAIAQASGLENQQPNILFILADDLGAHTMSIDGNPVIETPNLDRLAVSGTRFANGYANAPTCKPSRAAIMTGQYSPRTDIYRVVDRHTGQEEKIRFLVPPNGKQLALEKITIAEVLKDNGYRTAHFGKWHLANGARGLPGEQGFDTSIESHSAHFNAKTQPAMDLPEGTYIGDFMTDEAISFIDESVAAEEPFFLYVPYFLIHKPWEAKEAHLDYFKSKLGPDADETTVTVAAMTKSLDENAGRLLQHLEDSGLSKDTLVIFSSDNGGYKMKDNLLNAPLREYKGEVFEGGLRVPYLFSYPGVIEPGAILQDRIIGVDLFPTILSFAGIEKPDNLVLDGVDLRPLLSRTVDQLAPRPLYWYFPKYAGLQKDESWRDEWRNVIIDSDYKLIEYRESEEIALFDLKKDPLETTDLSPSHPELVALLSRKLSQWKERIDAPTEVPNPDYTGPIQPISEDLGYQHENETELPTASKEATEAWKDQRFGMFIHWGPISQMGKQLSHSRNSPSHRSSGGAPYKTAPIPPEVYDAQYKTFNPVKFDPDAMMKMAKEAGIAYVVFTAKHHAGFSMFDSAVSDYDIMAAPYGKDITRELADACHANGIDFGFYYSPRDWSHPDCDSDENHPRYIDFYKAQMTELLGNYGPIHSIFFDGLGPGDWGDTSADIMRMIRSTHPDAMVNDRGGAGADYYTPEHNVSYMNSAGSWEACHTTTGQWGYNPDVGTKSLRQLMEILLYTWGNDGNMLLNIGPMGDGAVNPVELERFQQIADWWQVHGETSIRESRGGPYLAAPWGTSTRKDNKVYLHVFHWGNGETLQFPMLDGLKVLNGRRLDGGPVRVSQKDGLYLVSVPESSRGDISTTVELVLDGDVMAVTPRHRVAPLTHKATLTASHNTENLPLIIDQNADTVWAVEIQKSSVKDGIWVEAAFDHPVEIASFAAPRKHSYMGRFEVSLQVPDENGEWRTLKGYHNRLRFTYIHYLEKPVITDRVRMRIDKGTTFRMSEWEIFSPPTNTTKP